MSRRGVEGRRALWLLVWAAWEDFFLVRDFWRDSSQVGAECEDVVDREGEDEEQQL